MPQDNMDLKAMEALQLEVERLRAQVEAYERLIERLVGKTNAPTQTPEKARDTSAHSRIAKILATFTVKQHCAYQMLMRGASNAEIAERMGVTESTAKVYVRGIMKKLGPDVHTRAQVILLTRDAYEAIPPETYREMSHGVPKDWDATWSPDAPDAYIFRNEEE
jgi:DNA-binding NarL/FixJ family response regulator